MKAQPFEAASVDVPNAAALLQRRLHSSLPCTQARRCTCDGSGCVIEE